MKTFGKILITVLVCGVSGMGVEYYLTQRAEAATRPPTVAQLKTLQVQLPDITTNDYVGDLVEMKLTVQAGDKKSFSDLTNAQDQVLDTVSYVIHEAPPEEFLTKSGLDLLHEQLLNQIQKTLPNDKIDTVYLGQVMEQTQ